MDYLIQDWKLPFLLTLRYWGVPILRIDEVPTKHPLNPIREQFDFSPTWRHLLAWYFAFLKEASQVEAAAAVRSLTFLSYFSLKLDCLNYISQLVIGISRYLKCQFMVNLWLLIFWLVGWYQIFEKRNVLCNVALTLLLLSLLLLISLELSRFKYQLLLMKPFLLPYCLKYLVKLSWIV